MGTRRVPQHMRRKTLNNSELFQSPHNQPNSPHSDYDKDELLELIEFLSKELKVKEKQNEEREYHKRSSPTHDSFMDGIDSYSLGNSVTPKLYE
jgi:hypothetical protein